jgi:MoaA/NifB/PqqE/SkfB family radical SAM enzyme
MRWVDSVKPEMLNNLTGALMEAKRRIFKEHVRLVEIESHAQCNRACSFCPNSILDRRHNQTVTDAVMLDRIFKELGSIDYVGQIKFARYSEPLANPILYERIVSARTIVPRAQLAIVTNTDYLTTRELAELRNAGLNVVYMSIYLKANEFWTPQIAKTYSQRLAKKLNIRIINKQETSISFDCAYHYNGLTLFFTCKNFNKYGTDRGGPITQYTKQQRLGPCREPFETFVIDYTGSVMPCCNLRSDLTEHREFIVGNLSTPDTSIFDVYAGRLSAWRHSLMGFDEKPFPCTTCRHRDIPEALAVPLASLLEKHLRLISRTENYGLENRQEIAEKGKPDYEQEV